MGSTFQIINYYDQIAPPANYKKVEAEGRWRHFNAIGLTYNSFFDSSKYEVMAKYERKLSLIGRVWRICLGVIAVVSTLGLAYLSPDVRNFFEAKAVIRYALEISDYANNDLIFIKFGDPELVCKEQGLNLKGKVCTQLIKNAFWTFKQEATTQLGNRNDLDEEKSKIVKRLARMVEGLMENAAKNHLNINISEIIEFASNDLDIDTIDLFLPVLAFLLEKDIKSSSAQYQNAPAKKLVEKIRNYQLTDKNLTLFNAYGDRNSQLAVLPREILAYIQANLIALHS